MQLQTPHRKYTPKEYLQLEEQAESKSEYHDGEIVPMTGGIYTKNQPTLYKYLPQHLDYLCHNKHTINMSTNEVKPVVWLGNSLDELKKFPEEVQDEMGFALYQAQINKKHPQAKPLKGFKGSGVLEIVDNFDGDTYRTIYTVKLAGVVYVLHAFQKKSKKGIATPPKDVELIKKRLKLAIETHEANQK